MNDIDIFIEKLPDAPAAARFLEFLREKNPAQFNKLIKKKGLVSDVLTLVAYSPLLATTLQQNPAYLWWLDRHRAESKVRGKDELLEALARFALTNSGIDTQVLLARFRRRELLRIFLHDIRRLSRIAEITEEISNLADAVLEHALQIAAQEMNNRFGIPLEQDAKGRAAQAEFCVVSLGKLGSKELNYSSDIDLLFIYSGEGTTSGQGTKGAVTNREYFIKLAEFVTKLVGQATGEGAAYRVDLRLRPHGRVGALALSCRDTIRYYRTTARKWEKQVLIRSRASAGSQEIYKKFFAQVEDFVFSKDESIADALASVRLSKEKINLELDQSKGFNVKLEKGGIREIEFIAQALQLAYGGRDAWLRSAHTLISLARLADRELLSENELTELFDGYEFLRHLEHILQMENGLQTHVVPLEIEKRNLIARRMNCPDAHAFDERLEFHTQNVNRIYSRVFGDKAETESVELVEKTSEITEPADTDEFEKSQIANQKSQISPLRPILASLEKSDADKKLSKATLATLEKISDVSPHFAEMLASNPALIKKLPHPKTEFSADENDYREKLLAAVERAPDFARRIAVLRKLWAEFYLKIAAFDAFGKISLKEAKRAQTELAEASIEAALAITRGELERQYQIKIPALPLAVLALGKLGGRGMDYGSDLDLVIIFDDQPEAGFQIPNSKFQIPNFKTEDQKPKTEDQKAQIANSQSGIRNLESGIFYSKAVEIFVTALSAMTRDGHLYRVDLRLRPDGKNGATAIGRAAFLNYLENRSAIWEWLAYVKIRGVAGDVALAENVETEARRIIHQKALTAGAEALKIETMRVRGRLEAEKSKPRAQREIDIKFGAGGMLDVYFAMRFLQLRDDVPDETGDRSTDAMLATLRAKKSLSAEDYENFSAGYGFLKELDHNLRLTVGRSTRLPSANQNALQIIAERMNLGGIGELLEKLTFHRLNLRASYENILEKQSQKI